MKVKLITEYTPEVEVNEEVVDESTDQRRMYIEGIFSSAEKENRNGRKYRQDTLKREIDKLQEHIDNKALWGELGHPNTPDLNLDRISILVEKLEWQGKHDVYGKAKVVDTPMGNIAKTLVKEGNIGISSRGLGQVQEDGYVDHGSFSLICFDLVSSPSNAPSWVNGVYEGKTFELPNVETEEEMDSWTEQQMIEEARQKYKQKIWQVIYDLEKKL